MPRATRSYELARRLVSAGHEVTLLTSSAFYPPASEDLPSGWSQRSLAGIDVRILNLSYQSGMSYPQRIARFGQFAWECARLATRTPADLVFATSTPLTIGIPGVLAARRQGVPLVFEVRDLWPDVPIALEALRSPLTRAAARRLEAWVYAHATALVTTSPGWVTRLRTHPRAPAQIGAIPHGADWEHFAADEGAGQRFRRERPWLQERPLILYAGALGLVNGLEYAVHTAAQLRELRPDARWLFLGDGRERDSLIALSRRLGVHKREVYFEPSVPKKMVAGAYSAATLTSSTVLPSAGSGVDFLPNKVVDSLTCGRAVAVNYDSWLRRELEESGAGFYLDPSSPRKGAQAIAAFLGDAPRQADAQEAARALARLRYDRDRHALELEAILSRACESYDGPRGGRRQGLKALAELAGGLGLPRKTRTRTSGQGPRAQ